VIQARRRSDITAERSEVERLEIVADGTGRNGDSPRSHSTHLLRGEVYESELFFERVPQGSQRVIVEAAGHVGIGEDIGFQVGAGGIEPLVGWVWMWGVARGMDWREWYTRLTLLTG